MLLIYKQIDFIQDYRASTNFMAFFYSMILMLRFFKGFRGQPRIAIMGLVMIDATTDMVHFLIIFILIYLNYAVGGWALFGPYVKEWSTLMRAMGSTLRMLWGRIDFQALFDEHPFYATVWFWSFIILVIFVILNLLTALIYDHYVNVLNTQNYRGAMTIWAQVYELFADKLVFKSVKERSQIHGGLKTVYLSEVHDKCRRYVEEMDARENGEYRDMYSSNPEWAVRRNSTQAQPDADSFAHSRIERDFLVEDCDLEEMQADYLLNKCSKSYISDQQHLNPETYL